MLMRDICTSSRHGAKLFLSKSEEFERPYKPDFTGINPKKPMGLLLPWYYPKKNEALKTLNLHLWQMPYEEAIKKERELKKHVWERLILKHTGKQWNG